MSKLNAWIGAVGILCATLSIGSAGAAETTPTAPAAAAPVQPPPPPRMKPGKWEASEVVTMASMNMKMPATTYDSFCLKAGEPEEKYVVPGTGGRADCTVSKPKVKDNHVSWSTACTDPAKPSTATGQITWQEETFSGTIVVKNQLPQLAKMGPLTAHVTGKRIGDCD